MHRLYVPLLHAYTELKDFTVVSSKGIPENSRHIYDGSFGPLQRSYVTCFFVPGLSRRTLRTPSNSLVPGCWWCRHTNTWVVGQSHRPRTKHKPRPSCCQGVGTWRRSVRDVEERPNSKGWRTSRTSTGSFPRHNIGLGVGSLWGFIDGFKDSRPKSLRKQWERI